MFETTGGAASVRTSSSLLQALPFHPGDLVLHTDYGLGRFVGVRFMVIEGEERRYLQLEYAASDQLAVPFEHINRVQEYRGAGTKLARLGSPAHLQDGGQDEDEVEDEVADEVEDEVEGGDDDATDTPSFAGGTVAAVPAVAPPSTAYRAERRSTVVPAIRWLLVVPAAAAAVIASLQLASLNLQVLIPHVIGSLPAQWKPALDGSLYFFFAPFFLVWLPALTAPARKQTVALFFTGVSIAWLGVEHALPLFGLAKPLYSVPVDLFHLWIQAVGIFVGLSLAGVAAKPAHRPGHA